MTDLNRVKAVLDQWEAWEAALILSDAAWGDRRGFMVADDSYDQYIELQGKRRALMDELSALPEPAEDEVRRLARTLCEDHAARLIAGAEEAPSFDESEAHVREYWFAIAIAALRSQPAPPPSEGSGSLREALEESCEDLGLKPAANDEPLDVLLARILKAAMDAIISAGRANVRAGLLRQERDLARDELAEALSSPASARVPDELVEDLVIALGKAAFQFETYEKLHSAKGTPDGYEKAKRNAEMATMCREAIANYRKLISSRNGGGNV